MHTSTPTPYTVGPRDTTHSNDTPVGANAQLAPIAATVEPVRTHAVGLIRYRIRKRSGDSPAVVSTDVRPIVTPPNGSPDSQVTVKPHSQERTDVCPKTLKAPTFGPRRAATWKEMYSGPKLMCVSPNTGYSKYTAPEPAVHNGYVFASVGRPPPVIINGAPTTVVADAKLGASPPYEYSTPDWYRNRPFQDYSTGSNPRVPSYPPQPQKPPQPPPQATRVSTRGHKFSRVEPAPWHNWQLPDAEQPLVPMLSTAVDDYQCKMKALADLQRLVGNINGLTGPGAASNASCSEQQA
jgi:hypothetical protein